MIGSGYELVKAFYDEVAQNEAMQVGCKPHHQSLYTWICELRNRTKREVLDLPVLYTMQMSFIGSQHTLAKAIDDLAEWGIIEVIMQTKGHGTKVKIAIAFMQKHCNSDAITESDAIAKMQMQCNTTAIQVQTTKSNKRDKRNKPPQSPRGDELVDPLALFKYQSDGFKTTWREWEQFRREQKKKLTASSIQKQLKLLASHSEAEAIAMLEQSIRNGWQGLFEISPASPARSPMRIIPEAVSRPTSLSDIR
ncbi:hypothetical protein [Spirosoma sp. KNUC1025]|uniref:hypothetical protein n=1 Tax=Spirosoma sp. KNUC1025 TaxID=2894082 RepID=UPI0038631063|nr:hypothetical protein LN737_00685 [Spirosoma sp. KNUC1025]